MSNASRKLVRKATDQAVLLTKKQLIKHPRIKTKLVNVLTAQLNSHSAHHQTYSKYYSSIFPDGIETVHLRALASALNYKPLISIVVPTYNTKPEHLRDCLDSMLSQIYDNWELCVVDDASPLAETRSIIKDYAAQDKRISYTFLKQNHHIAEATNKGIKSAKGEFISLLDHDDVLWPNALYEIAAALNKDRQLDLIYTDEDKITNDRHEHLGPFFKPDWNPDFLHSVNYITHFSTIRKSILDKIGGLRGEFNGAQDWDLFLRVTDMTDKVYHVPKVVYSWRVHEQSTAMTTDSKPYVVSAQKAVLKASLARHGAPDAIVEQDKKHGGYWQITYPVQGNPLISIVIPSKNQLDILKRCIDSIYAKTTYKNYEIIVVDTGSTDKRVFKWYRSITKQHDNFTVIDWPEQPFSYSRSCNAGAAAAKGELLMMLNNDTEVLTPQWLGLLAGDAQRPDIGAVGCLLFFPDGKHIQHAGVGVGLGGVAANSFSMMTLSQPMSQTQHLMLNTRHNMTVVTAACLMVKKSLYDQVGGFDEAFRVTYNDVDLCLRLYDLGLQNLYTPYVRLLHHESISVGLPSEIKKRDTTEFKTAKQLFISRWQKYVDHDPNLNPNLSKDNAFYDI